VPDGESLGVCVPDSTLALLRNEISKRNDLSS